MRKLLEAMTKFAGQPEQKPGEQWKGTDKGTPGNKLVGSADESVLKDLSKGVTPKTKEQELAEEWANFNEDDLGVEEKRPHRTGSRADKVGVRGHKEQPRYTTVKDEVDEATAAGLKVGDHVTANTSKGEYPGGHKSRAGKVTRVGQTGVHIRPDDGGEVEYHPYKIVKKTVKDKDVYEGWNNGTDRVQLADSTSAYWNGTGRLQAEYDELYNQLVPASGAAETLEGEVLRAASKIVYRHFNDGDLFNKASFDQLKGYIGTVTSYDDLAEKAVEYALRAQGNYHPNAGWDSLDVMDYGPEEEEEYEDDEDDDGWDNEDLEEGMEEFAKSQAKQRAAKRKSIPWPKEVPSDASQERNRTRDEEESDPHPYTQVGEGAVDVYSITSERNGRERSKSGTLAELIEYYGYTLETGKSYEHERGNSKINLNPKSIESLVQNLNNAKDNAAANGSSNERFYVDHGNMVEGRGDSKGLHKKVTIVKGRDAGKTGYVRQIKTDKLRNRVYLDLDLEDGGQAVVLKQDVRLVKDLAENYTGRETKDGVWRVFKDGQGGSVAGPFKSAEEASAWIKKQNQGVVEARTTWNNDFYVYDPKTKAVKKKFRTHRGAKQYAEANGLKVASAEYYHDTVSKEVNESDKEEFKSTYQKFNDKVKRQKEKEQTKEGWESGPEERTRVERDPDAEYDAMRQEKLDAEADKAQAQRPQTKVYTLSGRGPNNEPNYAFPGEYATQDEADAARAKLMADPNTPNPRDIGIRAQTKYMAESIESTDPVESAVLSAVQELIQQGHTEVAPEVITNMVVAATSQPFLLKDLVDCNNNSPAIQHYVDSINPTKVKFSNEILTVKNEDPSKDKAKSQAGVSSMASRAANRSRLGEGNETPLQDKEDYNAKRAALQQIQLDPDTAKDPQLKAELARRLGSLNQQYTDLQSKLREFKESRGHKAIATKLGNIDRMQNVQVPSPAERREQLRIAKAKEEVGKKQVKEFAAPGANPAPVTNATKPVVDPAAAAKTTAATSALKAATGSTAPVGILDKAINSATQGTAVNAQDMKALAPIMGVVDAAAADPKLAGQFKTLATQAQQSLKAQQKSQ